MATLHLNKVFNSFKEFEQAQEKYENENFMLWVKGRSTSIESTNALIRSKGRTDLFDEKLKYRYVSFSCKLGVLPNQEKRIGTGKGDRPRQESHKIGCPAYLRLWAKGRTQLFIKEFLPEHNHECNERIFDQLPENRDLTSDAQEKAKLLFEGGVKPSVVRNILRGLTGSVTARDLANYRARWKKEKHGGLSEEERLATVLQNLKEADDGASIFIGTDDKENLKYVFFQTSGMRKNVAQYGRVILLDHSHKVNKNRMPVCVLMVMDGEGNGRAAGYAFVANEQLVTVADVLSSFRQSIGEDVAMGVKTIVIDKDPSEIGAIREVFPDVHIQLCIFHVGRTLKEKSSKESTEVKEILDELKYVRTDARYKALCSQLEEAASVTFYEYFKENWLDCPQAWSFRDKQHSINLGNTTTNRVENHNAKIKMILNSKSTLADAVEGLLNIFTNKEEDVYFRETTASFKVAYLTTAISDPIVNAMLNDLTKFASDLLINELQNVPSEEEIVEYEGSTSECGCPHFKSFDLPCRHIFQCRRMQGEKPYQLGEIDSMWRKKRLCDVAIAPGLVRKKILPVTVPKTSREKYNAANDTCRLISSLLAECGSAQFHERSLVLKELFKLWAEGKEVVLLEKPKGASETSYALDSCVIEVLDMPCKDTSVNPGENAQPKVTSQAQHTAQETEMEHIKISDSTPDENAKQNETPQAQHTSQETEENGIPVIVLDSDDELCDTEVRDVYIKVEQDDFDTPKSPATQSTDIGLDISDFISTHHGASKDGGANRLSELVLAMDNDNESSGSNTKEKEMPLHSDTATPRKHSHFSDDDDDYDDNSLSQIAEALERSTQSTPSKSSDPVPKSPCTQPTPSKSLDLLPKSPCEETPLCRCRPPKPSRRYIAGPNSKPNFVGRQYYACDSTPRLCNFFRTAKMYTASQSQSDIKQALSGVKLLVSKPKGRPRGSTKTSMIKFPTDQRNKRPKNPRGAFPSLFETGVKGREARGAKIKDSDVQKIAEDQWTCHSQSNNDDMYEVTTQSCTCFDYTTNGLVCKHMFKIRSIVQGSSSASTTVVLTENPATGTCCTCRTGEPSHSCEKCQRPVHAIDTCSRTTVAGDGYGKPRLCLSCTGKSDQPKVPKKRQHTQTDLDLIEVAPPVPGETSVTTRAGRQVRKKKKYSPTKPW